MNSKKMTAATAAMIVMAGSAVTLAAWQNQNQPARPANNPPATTTNPNAAVRVNTGYAADYMWGGKILGADIENWNDEDIGDVDDLVIDRGSGQITHVVVKSGSVLGMGGRSVLIPFREFQWDTAQDRLLLGSDRINNYPVYTPESWKSLRTAPRPAATTRDDKMRRGTGDTGVQQPMPSRSTGSGVGSSATDPSNPVTNPNPGPPEKNPDGTLKPNSTNRTNTGTGSSTPSNTDRDPNREPRAQDSGEGATHANPNDRHDWARNTEPPTPPTLDDWMWEHSHTRASDPYAGQWTAGAKQRIEGEVKRVDRQFVPGQGEQIVLEVAAADGTTRRVAVGPSWYVTGGEQTFTRGDKVTIDAMPVYVATSAQVNGKNYRFREDSGKTAWSNETFKSGDTSYSAPYFRNVLLSELKGAKLDCRGVACGEVNDVILEMNSGMVAFLSLDPDDNFLGIADTKRLAPWGVASIGADGKVRVDTTKEMMTKAMTTPSDLTTLNQTQVDTIYGAYQVQPRDYDRWRDDAWYNDRSDRQRERDQWRRNRDAANTPK